MPSRSSNPFGFGEIYEPENVVVVQPRNLEKPFVKKRDAKEERKEKIKSPPKEETPEKKPVGRPQKFQKKDRSASLGFGL